MNKLSQLSDPINKCIVFFEKGPTYLNDTLDLSNMYRLNEIIDHVYPNSIIIEDDEVNDFYLSRKSKILYHSIRTAQIALWLADGVITNNETLLDITQAALFHDLGKIAFNKYHADVSNILYKNLVYDRTINSSCNDYPSPLCTELILNHGVGNKGPMLPIQFYSSQSKELLIIKIADILSKYLDCDFKAYFTPSEYESKSEKRIKKICLLFTEESLDDPDKNKIREKAMSFVTDNIELSIMKDYRVSYFDNMAIITKK